MSAMVSDGPREEFLKAAGVMSRVLRGTGTENTLIIFGLTFLLLTFVASMVNLDTFGYGFSNSDTWAFSVVGLGLVAGGIVVRIFDAKHIRQVSDKVLSEKG